MNQVRFTTSAWDKHKIHTSRVRRIRVGCRVVGKIHRSFLQGRFRKEEGVNEDGLPSLGRKVSRVILTAGSICGRCKCCQKDLHQDKDKEARDVSHCLVALRGVRVVEDVRMIKRKRGEAFERHGYIGRESKKVSWMGINFGGLSNLFLSQHTTHVTCHNCSR